MFKTSGTNTALVLCKGQSNTKKYMLLQANCKGTQPEVMEIIKELRKKINELMEWQELM